MKDTKITFGLGQNLKPSIKSTLTRSVNGTNNELDRLIRNSFMVWIQKENGSRYKEYKDMRCQFLLAVHIANI